MPNIGPMELIVIFALVIIVFGVAKVPEIGRSLGKGLREFTKAKSEIDEIKKPLTVQYWVDAAQPTPESTEKNPASATPPTTEAAPPQAQPEAGASSGTERASQQDTDQQPT